MRFFYDFDRDELAAARPMPMMNVKDEAESEDWYEEYFLPYLNDIAIDNAGEVIEDLIEEFDVEAQYIAYETDIDSYDYCEFIAVIVKKVETL